MEVVTETLSTFDLFQRSGSGGLAVYPSLPGNQVAVERCRSQKGVLKVDLRLQGNSLDTKGLRAVLIPCRFLS